MLKRTANPYIRIVGSSYTPLLKHAFLPVMKDPWRIGMPDALELLLSFSRSAKISFFCFHHPPAYATMIISSEAIASSKSRPEQGPGSCAPRHALPYTHHHFCKIHQSCFPAPPCVLNNDRSCVQRSNTSACATSYHARNSRTFPFLSI